MARTPTHPSTASLAPTVSTASTTSSTWEVQRLDVTTFARQGAQWQGNTPLQALGRLRDLIHPPAAGLGCEWQLEGLWRERPGAQPEVRVLLQAQAEVVLTCQRCLAPSTHSLTLERRFRFVATEEEAERLDEQAGDEEDVLALSARVNMVELLEDELIMALPLVALHEVCPEVPEVLKALSRGKSTRERGDDEGTDPDGEGKALRTDHPFAALAQLKGKVPPKT